MPKRVGISTLVSWLVMGSVLLPAPGIRAQAPQQGKTIVTVDKFEGRIVYAIDSHRTKDILFSLNQVADNHGASQPIMILVDSRLPSAEIWNVAGVAAKAQLSNLRFFVVFHDAGRMSEIKRMPAIPISASPPTS
jgi:hypothetical protein